MVDKKRRLRLTIFFIYQMLAFNVFAQETTTNKAPPLKGKVVVDEASVYSAPSFDAEVVNSIPKDSILSMSRRKFEGIFHRVLLENKTTGFVSDDQIRPIQNIEIKSELKSKKPDNNLKDKKNSKKINNLKEKKKSDEEIKFESSKNKVLKYTETRWFGLTFSQIQFREDSMGEKLSENLQFFGFKIAGPDVLIEGPAPTEINFQIYSQAPSYYSKKTGRDASGLIFISDFMSKHYTVLSKDLIFDYGFGLLFRYSRFNVALLDDSTVRTYRLEDIVLGLKFAIGLGFRFTDQFAIKTDAFYNWEKQSYMGYGLTLQKSF